MATLQASLREQGRLLVDDQAAHRYLRAEGGGGADDLVTVDQPGEPLIREVEEGQEMRVPLKAVHIQQERARRGADVGDELAGEPVHDPGIGGGDHPVTREILAQPGHLRSGEIAVEDQPSAAVDLVGVVA